MAKDITNPKYYEGIFQLRDVNKKVVDYVFDRIESDDNVFVSKINELKNGIDIYISSNKFGRRLLEELKRRFNGEAKTSSSLFSVDKETSKEVYRVTFLFRLLDFKLGDEGIIRGSKVKIKNMGRQIVSCVDLETGKRCSFKIKEFRDSFKPS